MARVALWALLIGGGMPIAASGQDVQSREPQLPPTLQESADRARESREERVRANPTRLRVFLDETVLSPTLAPRLAFAAALDHRSHAPEEWGRGADGFGKRFAAQAGLTMAQTGLQHATAAVMKVDPRGERQACGCRHPLRRTAHALTSTFVTRDTRGRLVPNVPLVAGAFGGALLATAWYPPSFSPRSDAVRVASLTIVAQAGANVFREFSPEVKRLIKRTPRD